jgi:hypothetical protein
MKKCSPFHGQNGQLVHWWVLVHSGREKVDVWNWNPKITNTKF